MQTVGNKRVINAMKGMGLSKLDDLKPEQYGELINQLIAEIKKGV
jgi:hypothetical protein